MCASDCSGRQNANTMRSCDNLSRRRLRRNGPPDRASQWKRDWRTARTYNVRKTVTRTAVHLSKRYIYIYTRNLSSWLKFACSQVTSSDNFGVRTWLNLLELAKARHLCLFSTTASLHEKINGRMCMGNDVSCLERVSRFCRGKPEWHSAWKGIWDCSVRSRGSFSRPETLLLHCLLQRSLRTERTWNRRLPAR